MQGYELKKQIAEEKSVHPERVFIKWWRKEEDWLDFDLVSRFLDNLDYATNIDGFDLIDQDEMWRTIERRCGSRIKKVERNGQWVLLYNPPKGAEVEEKVPEYPYTPESLVKILDMESDYNFID